MKKARNPLWDRAFCLKYLLRGLYMEAPPGIGPGIKVLQTSALPLGYGAVYEIMPTQDCP